MPRVEEVDPELLRKKPGKIRQMFAEVAPRYDLLNRLLSFGVDVRWRRRMARLGPRPLTGPVLDVCCGTGDLALTYWRVSGRTATVVGVDFCLPMLFLARGKAERLGANDRSAWIAADVLALPFPDDVFQVVAVAFGIRNVADPDRALREMLRVCRPGGQVGVLEFSLPKAGLWRRIYGWYFRQVLPRVGNLVAGSRINAYSYLPASVHEFDYGPAFAKRMLAAGSADVVLHPFTGGIATCYLGLKPGKL